jgi:hypothetical protein
MSVWPFISSWPFFVSVAFVVGIFVASLLWKRDLGKQTKLPKQADHRKFPMKKIHAVLSEFERGVYRTLQHEVGSDYVLFPKMRLENILTLSRKSKREEFYHNLLKSRQITLLACDRNTYAPMMAIQIIVGDVQNDEEELTAHLLQSAEIPCLQLPLKNSFSPTELMELVRNAIKERHRSAVSDFQEVKTKVF